MARKRYQRGALTYDDRTGKAWGRWREDVIDTDGAVCRKKVKKFLGTFKNKKSAKQELDKQVVLSDINNPNYRPRMDASFAVFAERWTRDVLSQHKVSTQAGDGSRIKKHIRPYFEKMAVRDITAFDVQAFVSSSKLGAKSKRNLVATLRMMHNSAKAWNLTTVDWFVGLKLPEWIKPEAPAYTLEQMIRIIDAAEEPFKTFYWIVSETGIRLGEGCALRPCDFNFDAGVVVIRWSAWHGHVGTTKSKKPRVFQISTKLAAHLKLFTASLAPQAYIFHREDGTPWIGDWDVVESHLKPLLKTLGIAPTGLHAFRHGNASLMDQMNTPLKVRQDRLGHVDGEALTLGTYTHAQSADHQRVADGLGNMLRPTAAQQWPKSHTERTQ